MYFNISNVVDLKAVIFAMAAAREEQQTCPDPERGESFQDATGLPRQLHADKGMEMFLNGELTSVQNFFVNEELMDISDAVFNLYARRWMFQPAEHTCELCGHRFGIINWVSVETKESGRDERVIVPVVTAYVRVIKTCMCHGDSDEPRYKLPLVFYSGVTSASMISYMGPTLDRILEVIRKCRILLQWQVTSTTEVHDSPDRNAIEETNRTTTATLPQEWEAHEWGDVLDHVKGNIVWARGGEFSDACVRVCFRPTRLWVPGLE